MKKVLSPVILAFLLFTTASAQQKHSFTFDKTRFMLDGKPLRIISGEIHPARVPAEYWRHRIQMAKAMGCNTIAAYIFWNYQEPEPVNSIFRQAIKTSPAFCRSVRKKKCG